jgi:hypothetical protein
MPEHRTKRRAHIARKIFRYARLVVLLGFCFSLGFVLWCNVVGVPGVIEKAIREEARRRGVDFEFAELRLKGFWQLVARNVQYHVAGTNAPSFTAPEAEFIVDYQQLRMGKIELIGLHLTDGKLILPLEPSGKKSLLVTNINSDLHFEDGRFRVVNFTAETLGAKARLTGDVKHPWRFKISDSGVKEGGLQWQHQILEVIEIAEQLKFRRPPELNLTITADGDDIASTRATISIRADEATSKWGTFDQLQLFSSILPAATNMAMRGDFVSVVAGFRSRFGVVESLEIKGETLWTRNMERMITNTVQVSCGSVGARWFRLENGVARLTSFQEATNGLIHSRLELATGAIEASKSRAQSNTLTAELQHFLPFPSPASWLAKLVAGYKRLDRPGNQVSGNWQLESSIVGIGAARLETVSLNGKLQTRPGGPGEALEVRLESPWELVATNVQAKGVQLGGVQLAGHWAYPELRVTNLNAQLYGGYLKGAAELNVLTKEAVARTEMDFPYEKLSTLLEEQVQRWIGQFEWEDPPYVRAESRWRFPNWDGDWKTADVVKTLAISGQFEGGGKFRGVPVENAESRFHFTNFVWTLPDLTITRPEGQARVDYTGNVTNGDFTCEIDSRIDPGILKVMVPKEYRAKAEVVKFATPPHIIGSIAGNWDEPTKLSLKASIASTNFFVKEQAFSGVQAEVYITNNLIHCSNLVAYRGSQIVRAPYLRVDLPGEIMFVTNVVSQTDPYVAMSLIGEDAYDAIDPYRFAQVPTVRVNGIVPLRHWSKADLRFEVAGEEFSFWRFRMPYLVGDVHWKADHISFSNVTASFYGGKANWSGYFIIDHRDDTANYSFAANTTNSELKYLLADLTGRTNHIEGKLDGELIITSANSGNDRSWNGYGSASINDGFLWGVPVFGIFTPVLDGIAPGLGTSRITAGEGSFTITNSVVHTRDMQVRAPAFRLGYKGKVDLDGNLDAVAEAQIFRDAWVVGKLFSIALWPVSKAFEAKVSGTVEAPKTDLRYVPRFLLAPFRALNALGDGGNMKEEGVERR